MNVHEHEYCNTLLFASVLFSRPSQGQRSRKHKTQWRCLLEVFYTYIRYKSRSLVNIKRHKSVPSRWIPKLKCHEQKTVHQKALVSKIMRAKYECSTTDTSVGWLYWGFMSLQRYFRHIATWKQEITKLWNFKWRGRESNPGPLAPQAKSF